MCCNRRDCIVTRRGLQNGVVSRGRLATRQARLSTQPCLRTAHGHDTAACALRHGRLRACDTTTVPTTRPLCPRHGRPQRPRYGPCARLCAPVGQGCALGAPSQFLDSILFLSHCLDTVHEHCSQDFSKKKK